MQQFNIVHADLTSESILVQFDQDCHTIVDLRIIDFGSSVNFEDLDQIVGISPEYLPPEVLDFISKKQEDPNISCESVI